MKHHIVSRDQAAAALIKVTNDLASILQADDDVYVFFNDEDPDDADSAYNIVTDYLFNENPGFLFKMEVISRQTIEQKKPSRIVFIDECSYSGAEATEAISALLGDVPVAKVTVAIAFFTNHARQVIEHNISGAEVLGDANVVGDYKRTLKYSTTCVEVVRAMMGVVSKLSDEKVNVVRDYFSEVLALSAFGCRCGLQTSIHKDDAIREVERAFHANLISDLVQGGVIPDTETRGMQGFVRTRLQEYHAVLAEHGAALATMDLDPVMKGIGVIFEQGCRGPQANHDPNSQDAPLVLYLRHVASEIFRGSLEATKQQLQG